VGGRCENALAALVVVGLSASSPSKLNLEPLVVCLVFDKLDERLFVPQTQCDKNEFVKEQINVRTRASGSVKEGKLLPAETDHQRSAIIKKQQTLRTTAPTTFRKSGARLQAKRRTILKVERNERVERGRLP
jgi:hypothetical protein